jgi:hypothetical protein
MKVGASIRRNQEGLLGGLKLKACSLLLFALCLSCATNGKDEPASDGSWYVTIRGKVGYPDAGGQVTLSEMTDGGMGWQDTISV